MYYELLQQRCGRGICKQAVTNAIVPTVTSVVRAIAPSAAKATGTAAKAIGTTAKATGSAATRPMRYAGRSGPKVSTTGTAARRPTIIDAELVDDVVKTIGTATKPGIISRLKAFGQQHGKGMAYGALGTGAGYGLYNMLGDDNDQYIDQPQTPSMSDAQMMAQNGWNGWDWNDLGGSLANYVTSGKIAEHAIPAILAFMAGRVMS